MVGDGENILVEYDYNNIIVVDPNKIVDENGNAKERLVKQENLVMYANLECKLVPRTKLAIGVAPSDRQQTISLATINFLKPGDKSFLENDWTDSITGKNTIKGQGVNQPGYETVPGADFLRQTILTGGKPGSLDTGLLGIVGIDITQNTSFMPVITVRLTDIKGRALFELGDNSPYAAFFNLPYPMFYLTIKGYYGKAIRLPLMLQSFNSSFDYSSQNFDITLKFYTYKYSVLSDLTMGALLATPHMFPSTISVTPKQGGSTQLTNSKNSVVERGYQKMKEIYSEYKSKGLISEDMPELTILELRNNIDNFVNNILDTFTKENLAPLNNLDSYSDTLNEYRKDVFLAVNGSWFSDFMDSENFYVLKNNGGEIYTFKDEDVSKNKTALSKLENEYIDKYNKKLNNNPVCGKNGQYSVGGKGPFPSSINCNVTLQQFIFDSVTENDIDFEQTILKRKKGKQKPTSAEIAEAESNFKLKNSLGGIETKNGKKYKIQWFRFESGTTGIEPNGNIKDSKSFILKPNTTFMEYTSELGRKLSEIRKEIETKLTDALSDILQSKNNGIGFNPTIRNVLSVIFANGEAFLRLLDDTHTNAWNLNSDLDATRERKKLVFNTSASDVNTDNPTPGYDKDTPIYPWPQVIVSNRDENGDEKYSLEYPGKFVLQSNYKTNVFTYWPEVEFVEEFITALTKRDEVKKNPEPIKNETLDITKASLNPIEFPINNEVFSNKEEIKYFFEIYERISLYSDYTKLSRSSNSVIETDLFATILSEFEYSNINNSLLNDSPFLLSKLKEYTFTSINYLEILRHFSNDGIGESWQNFLRGVFNTSYLKNLINNSQFSFINPDLLSSSICSPSVSVSKQDELSKYFNESTTSNEYDFSDTYPLTDLEWIKFKMADSKNIGTAKQAFNTTKVLNYDQDRKTITNFKDNTNTEKIRPITNFNWVGKVISPSLIDMDYPLLKDFYKNRNNEDQLPTEGNVIYSDYTDNLLYKQTTSVLNTPYFINSIQEGVSNFRNYEKYPFVSSAYYFINSLPVATLRERYKSYTPNGDLKPNIEELDYIMSSFKKFGAIHKVPYAWILKIGSVWHRYKKYNDTGVDILEKSWSGFSYVDNYDPETSNPEKIYSLSINGSQIDIVLQDNTFVGGEEFTLINVGFYPKLINDFNVFYQGFNIYSGFTSLDIQSGFTLGVNLNYVDNAIIDLPRSGTTGPGFDPTSQTRSLRIIPWSVTVDTLDDKFSFVFPSAGSLINQTKNECFDITKTPNSLKTEVINNESMYNGSVRNFWAAPNYGYFNTNKLETPYYSEYLKTINPDSNIQSNFDIKSRIGGSDYTSISDLFSTFNKDILDSFENEFLNFSKSIYDTGDGINTNTNDVVNNISNTITLDESKKKMLNFQSFMIDMMKISKVNGQTGTDYVSNVQITQTANIVERIKNFLNFDIVFKFGNPSNYSKRLFYTFSTFEISDPYVWDNYTILTPNALPATSNSVTFSQSFANYQEEWKALFLYVGFSEIVELTYKDSGSYITDFFIDNNIAFTVNNIKNLYPIIKIYATQKLSDPNLNPSKFTESMNEYILKNDRFLGRVLNNVFTNVRNKLPNVSVSTNVGTFSKLDGNQTKYEIYDTLKSLNDKWISGSDFKNKTLFEDVLLVDRASRNIGDKILVDIYKLKNRLTNINADSTMLSFIQSILVENNFVIMNLPSYINFYNVQDVTKNAIPKFEGTTEFANNLFGTFLNVDYRDSSSKMVCFYSNKPSEHLNLKNNVDYRYRNDGLDISKTNNALVETSTNKQDHALSNRVVGFNVDIGPQNQQIFNGFNVRQTAGKATTESLQILNEMANLRGNRAGSTQSTSLYNLYKNRSYSCSVSMMGNAMIQPTMYFNLRYVPMFSGSYMILEVTHKISPGTFTTSFTGVRQNASEVPPVDPLQVLKANLLQSIQDTFKTQKDKENTQSNTDTAEKDKIIKQETSKNSSTLSINQSCQPINKYSNFTKINPTIRKYNSKEIIEKINEILNVGNYPLKLKVTIFASIYINSYDTNNIFKAYDYNFASIGLNENWAQLGNNYFNSNYFCSYSETPMSSFNNLDALISMLRDHWKNTIGKVKNIDKTEITKFLIIYSGFKPNEDVYKKFSQEELSVIEDNLTQKAIDLFNAASQGISP